MVLDGGGATLAAIVWSRLSIWHECQVSDCLQASEMGTIPNSQHDDPFTL